MSQPDWKYRANLGDTNPLDHGGFFVFEDKTGVYPPEAEILEVPEDEDGEYTVYRFALEPCTYIDGVLSDNKYHPECPAWFASDIEDVSRSVGNAVEELIECLCSTGTLSRADGYRDLIGYHGPQNFDNYPLTLTRKEANARYADLGFGELSEKLKAIRRLKKSVSNRLKDLEEEGPDVGGPPYYVKVYVAGQRAELTRLLDELNEHDEYSV